MRIFNAFAFLAILLVAVMLNHPALALELPWEKEGGTAASQPGGSALSPIPSRAAT